MHKQLLVQFYGLLTVSELFATDDGMQCSTGYSLARGQSTLHLCSHYVCLFTSRPKLVLQ